MKRFSAVFFMVIIFATCNYNCALTVAFASGSEFLRVIDNKTPFYADEKLSEFLFYLPYTYYVKLISVSGNVARIECTGSGLPAIDGYAEYDKLFFDGQTVTEPYANVKLCTCKSAAMYADASLTTELRYVFAERELLYYGYVSVENGYAYFVAYGGSVGYIKEDCLYPFSLPEHPNTKTFLNEEKNEPVVSDNKTSNSSVSFTIRIAVIACLIAAGLIAAVAFKRPRRDDDYYDENDYG